MDRRLGDTQTSLRNHLPSLHTRHILSEPASLPPDSVTDSLLPFSNVTRILSFHEQNVYWQHGSVYFPNLWEEVRVFYEVTSEEEGWEKVDGTWTALFFVLQAIAVHQMTDEQVVACGLNEGKSWSTTQANIPADRFVVPTALIAAAMSSLHHADYLSRPTIYTCQTIAILAVCGHNVCDSDLLSSLLAIGIKLGQTLNLHALGKAGAQDVVVREVGKRVWWSLTMEVSVR